VDKEIKMKYQLSISGIKNEKELNSLTNYIRYFFNKNEVIGVNGDLKEICGEIMLNNGVTISYNKMR
jgi:hypothetical protein